MAVFLVISIVSILMVLLARKYGQAYPEHLVTALFSPTTDYFRQGETADLLEQIALTYAIAIEANGRTNATKGKWLVWAAVSLLGSIFALIGLLTILILITV